jgi:endogenous inhibitor of DNA gyrase (YacG/DUF329 family)
VDAGKQNEVKIESEIPKELASMPLTVKCPTCHLEVSWEGNPHRPFCSERCRLIDLGAWAEGKYRVPGEKVDDKPEKEDEEEEQE